MRVVVVLLGAMLGFISAVSPSFAQSDIFAGQWRTDWGPAEVLRDGSGFRGSYVAEDGNADNNGSFVLTRKAKTWAGFWAEPNSNEKCDTKRFDTFYWGRLKLGSAFSKSGFDMNWGYCDDRNPSRLWVFNIKTGDAPSALVPPVNAPAVYEASSVIKKLRSGFWRGAVKSNASGLASYCFLSAQKQDEAFTIQLYWNADGFHVLIFSEDWSLVAGDTFQGRVRIDDKFDGLIEASILDSESIDYTFGFNKKARKAFQRGSQISMEGPLGIKSFKLNGTRKAVKTLRQCAQEYLLADDAPIASTVPTYEKGLAAYKDNDFKGALANWRPLAEQGDARLQSYVAEMYRDGEGVTQDYKEAVRWFRLAADQGSDRAQNSLGLRYYNGQGVSVDFKKAVYWFRAAAKQGNATAQNNLGEMYRDGEGVILSTKKAKTWFSKAAKQGNERGQENLDALLASAGSSIQILTDEADDIGRSGAELPLPDLPAALPYGDENETPNALADDLLNRAALILAEYEEGSLAQAFELADGAAKLGDRRGQWLAGRMALAGVGVAPDRVRGMALILAAAEAGHPEALTYMGLQYLQDGDDASTATGMDYLERAAEQSHAPAQSALRFFKAEASR